MKKISRFRDERDWLKFHNPKDLSAAISIEAAELLELFLWKDKQTAASVKRNRKQLLSVEEEMADVAIYLLSLSDVLKIDLARAIIRKLKSNALKYPVPMFKDRADKYNELN
ncbi:MAG: nucleotide pyrophosphohydrolase [Thaumarchaeota archaeon]|nr:nucleotide pyrophosphohydrolase [Nitrososphaerota archaeon]